MSRVRGTAEPCTYSASPASGFLTRAPSRLDAEPPCRGPRNRRARAHMAWTSSIRSSFWLKPVVAIGLAAMADACFWGGHVGSAFGAFALAIALTAMVVPPDIRRDRTAA